MFNCMMSYFDTEGIDQNKNYKKKLNVYLNNLTYNSYLK